MTSLSLLVMPLLMQSSMLFGFFCCSSTLFMHTELVVHQDPQVLFHAAAPQSGRSQSMLHSWIMFAQVQDLTFVLVERQVGWSLSNLV